MSRSARWLPEWRGRRSEAVTIRDLLAHSSGLERVPAVLPRLHRPSGIRAGDLRLPLEYAPRTQSIYSDLGFMLLGFILEETQPSSASFRGAPGTFDPATRLQSQFQRIATFVTSEPLAFNPPRDWRERTAPTELDQWRGRLLVGEVHDENTWALGGAAGHAGLFGTVGAVGMFGQAVLRTLGGQRVLAEPTRCGSSFGEAEFRAARARSAGTRCSRRRRAARGCHRRRSVTPASPARRCGSTGSGTSTSSC